MSERRHLNVQLVPPTRQTLQPPLRLDLPDIEASDGKPGYGPVLEAILAELRAIRAALDKVTR